MDKKNEMNPELIRLAKKCGLLNPKIENLLDFCKIVEDIAKVNQSFALSIVANAMTCFALDLSDIQPENELSSFSLTEPTSGSDIKNLKTFYDFKIVKGVKTLVTNAEMAKNFMVLAKTEKGEVLCLCKRKNNCISVRKLDTTAFRGSGIGVVKFNVEPEIVLKDGIRLSLNVLNYSRPAFSAIALGISEKCFEIALNYAKRRKSFNKKLIEHQAVKFALAECFAEIESLKSMVYKASKKPNSVTSAVCKLLAAKTIKKVVDCTMQVLGGHSLVRGGYVERAYRDCKAFDIGEGTNEVMKIIISKTF